MNQTSIKFIFQLVIVLCLLSNIADAQEQTSGDDLLAARLEMAGENKAEILKAIESAPQDHQAAVKFLVTNMRRADLESLSAEFILEQVRLAYEAKEKAPWADQIPEEVFLNDILPYANVDETRENWRGELFEICWPIVKDCETTEQAAQELNKHLFGKVGVKYSTQRKKANQSPAESMDQGLASCTGLSILLADACRSVNVPARLAGIPSWTNKQGNHTWVEVWADNDWHFTGAAEYNAAGLDRAWFQGDASLADKTQRLNSIYAISFARTETTFPMVWSRDRENAVFAVNVTDRYTGADEEAEPAPDKILVRFRVWNADHIERVATKILVKPTGEFEADENVGPLTGTTTNNTADMNDMLEFELQREIDYEMKLVVGEGVQVHRFSTTNEPTQLVEVDLKTGSKKNANKKSDQ